MSDDASLGGKQSLLSTSSVILLLHLPGLALHQSSITHPSVMHQSCLSHASVMHLLRPSPLLSVHSALWPPQMQPRRILALRLTDRPNRLLPALYNTRLIVSWGKGHGKDVPNTDTRPTEVLSINSGSADCVLDSSMRTVRNLNREKWRSAGSIMVWLNDSTISWLGLENKLLLTVWFSLRLKLD